MDKARYRQKPEAGGSTVVEAYQFTPLTDWYEEGGTPTVVPRSVSFSPLRQWPMIDEWAKLCPLCGTLFYYHGFLREIADSYIIHPGNWVVEDDQGSVFQLSPEQFSSTYVLEAEEK